MGHIDRRPLEYKRTWILIPVFGSLLFIVMYFLAAKLYPGGSQADQNSPGFSWINNYWCNLLSENAINGQVNPSRPVALTGMLVLCLTLSSFWLIFPIVLGLGKTVKRIIQFSGVIGMATAMLLFTGWHDTITNVASLFGLIAVGGTLAGLVRIKWPGLLIFGILNLLLVGLNNYVYYTMGLIIYLPVIQKISFAAFLIWICLIDLNLYLKAHEQTISATFTDKITDNNASRC